MILAYPWFLMLLLLVPVFWLCFRTKHHIGYSDMRLVQQARSNGFLHSLPKALFTIGYCLLVFCLARPQMPYLEGSETVKSRDIIVAVDRSGSMGQQFAGQIPPDEIGTTALDKEMPVIKRPPRVDEYGRVIPENAKLKRRIDAAQAAIKRFVRQRFVSGQGDRIGIMVFDYYPRWSWPLTDDLLQIYRKGLFLDEGMGGGTNFGDNKPGPIDAAAEHFDEMGKAATKVLIMVTDGEDSIGSWTRSRLSSLMQTRDVRFYVIGVGETLARRDVDITVFAQSIGGKVFRVENANDMAAVFDTINELERTQIAVNNKIGYRDIFFLFALAGAGIILSAALAESFILSR